MEFVYIIFRLLVKLRALIYTIFTAVVFLEAGSTTWKLDWLELNTDDFITVYINLQFGSWCFMELKHEVSLKL